MNFVLTFYYYRNLGIDPNKYFQEAQRWKSEVVTFPSSPPIPLNQLNHFWKAEDLFVMNCGGGGDCLFHALGYALNMRFQQVRQMTASFVNEHNVDHLLHFYQHIFNVGNWNREQITQELDRSERVKKMQNIMQQGGAMYQGDIVTLQILNCYTDLGFVIIPQHQPIHYELFINSNTQRVIVLFHTGNAHNGHWMLVVLRHFEIQKLFDIKEVPQEIQEMLYETCGATISGMLKYPPKLYLEKNLH